MQKSRKSRERRLHGSVAALRGLLTTLYYRGATESKTVLIMDYEEFPIQRKRQKVNMTDTHTSTAKFNMC